jgi:hypothetical protein
MAVSLIRRIFTISLLYKTAQEGTSKKMQGHPLHVSEEGRWHGHRTFFVDGSGCSMGLQPQVSVNLR